MTCFSNLAIVLYYEIMSLGFDYNRIDLVFDRYFDDGLKEGTGKSRGTGIENRQRKQKIENRKKRVPTMQG